MGRMEFSQVFPKNKVKNGLTGQAQSIIFSGSDGVIAQLGERLHGMQEVLGSSPSSSTKKARFLQAGLFPFRRPLGSSRQSFCPLDRNSIGRRERQSSESSGSEEMLPVKQSLKPRLSEVGNGLRVREYDGVQTL
jgi:hypothetical protein